mmetsp:Transcript_320/g.1073  ORF Transcript_320/g.1073 Transcript_320/m.1073 type:complete len:200 (-) Transcript_320:1651-2250(-)
MWYNRQTAPRTARAANDSVSRLSSCACFPPLVAGAEAEASHAPGGNPAHAAPRLTAQRPSRRHEGRARHRARAPAGRRKAPPRPARQGRRARRSAARAACSPRLCRRRGSSASKAKPACVGAHTGGAWSAVCGRHVRPAARVRGRRAAPPARSSSGKRSRCPCRPQQRTRGNPRPGCGRPPPFPAPACPGPRPLGCSCW